MKRKIISLFAFVAVVSLSFSLTAQTKYHLSTHSITIEGTSNVRSWDAEVTDVSGEFILKATGSEEVIDIEKITIRIKASALEGSEGRRMNDKIYETLNTRRYPNITFQLRQIQQLSSSADYPELFRVVSTGVLTISGVSRTVKLNTAGRLLPNGTVFFSGSEVINMSDYGVTPPTAMLGALRTREEVTVKYSISLTPAESITKN